MWIWSQCWSTWKPSPTPGRCWITGNCGDEQLNNEALPVVSRTAFNVAAAVQVDVTDKVTERLAELAPDLEKYPSCH